MKLIKRNSEKQNLCPYHNQGNAHLNKKKLEYQVLVNPKNDSGENNNVSVYDEDFKTSRFSENQQKIIIDLAKRMHFVSGFQSSQLQLLFYTDSQQDRNPLPWHQDLWQDEAQNPDMLFFCVLERDLTNCTHCETGANNESHPKVRLLLGKTDKQLKAHFLADVRDKEYNPENTPESITEIEKLHDQTEAGYIIDQQARDEHLIIHTRTRQKNCPSTRITMVARLKSLDVDPSLSPQEEQAHKLESISRLLTRFNRSGHLNDRIKQLLIAAVDLGDPRAMSHLGKAYMEGHLGLEKDHITSLHQLEDAIKLKEQQHITADLDTDYATQGEILSKYLPEADIPKAMFAFAKAAQLHRQYNNCRCMLKKLKEKQQTILQRWIQDLPNNHSADGEVLATADFNQAEAKAKEDKPEAIKMYLTAASRTAIQENKIAWTTKANQLLDSMTTSPIPEFVIVCPVQ